MSDSKPADLGAIEQRLRADIQAHPEYARRVLARVDAGAPLDCSDEELQRILWQNCHGDCCSLGHMPRAAGSGNRTEPPRH